MTAEHSRAQHSTAQHSTAEEIVSSLYIFGWKFGAVCISGRLERTKVPKEPSIGF